MQIKTAMFIGTLLLFPLCSFAQEVCLDGNNSPVPCKTPNKISVHFSTGVPPGLNTTTDTYLTGSNVAYGQYQFTVDSITFCTTNVGNGTPIWHCVLQGPSAHGTHYIRAKPLDDPNGLLPTYELMFTD